MFSLQHDVIASIIDRLDITACTALEAVCKKRIKTLESHALEAVVNRIRDLCNMPELAIDHFESTACSNIKFTVSRDRTYRFEDDTLSVVTASRNNRTLQVKDIHGQLFEREFMFGEWRVMKWEPFNESKHKETAAIWCLWEYRKELHDLYYSVLKNGE